MGSARVRLEPSCKCIGQVLGKRYSTRCDLARNTLSFSNERGSALEVYVVEL